LENIAVNKDRSATEFRAGEPRASATTGEAKAPAGEPAAPAAGAVQPSNAWTRFWFTPTSTTGMQCLRFGSGLLFLAWLVSFVGHQVELFSLNGWLDRKALEEMGRQENLAPVPIGWSILYLAGDSVALFQALYWGSLAVLALFTLGIATRITGVLTWVIVVSFFANPATSYEGDYLLGILAFYLMIGHLLVGQWHGNLSIAERILGARDDFVFARWLFPPRVAERPASCGANFMMRLVQIHFVMIIVTSALHKLQISDWWSGVALWYPLHPTFKTTAESLQRERPNVDFTLFYLSLAQYLVLAWQLGLPFFAWRPGRWWRGLLVGGAAVGWLGASFLFQLPLFGPFVLLGCLSFLRPEEWEWVKNSVHSRLGGAVTTKAAPGLKKVAVSAGKDTIKK
jgi:hypothetical protein